MLCRASRRLHGLLVEPTQSLIQPCVRHEYFRKITTAGSGVSDSNVSSSGSQSPTGPPSSSIFSTKESPWNHVFDNAPQLMPATLRNPLSTSRRPRRQKMTAREISAFDDMFNMIFDAVAEQKNGSSHAEKTPGIAIGGNTGLSDLFGKLRRHSRAMKWTTEEEELLDKKKEEMDLCDTDQQLLDWAMKEVFGESERYERESREAMEEVTKNGGSSKMVLPMLQPPTYPHLLALIMRTFRDKYHDPNLTLSMFDYARHLSIPSYVFGCSTAVYNELLETRWRCFQDLRGVHDALEEMSVNGVDVDNNTRKIVERVRREVGERTLWEEDDLGNGQTWSMLEKIEKLTVPRHSKSKRRSSKKAVTGKPAKWDDWKNEGDKSDGWEFDSWDKPGKMR